MNMLRRRMMMGQSGENPYESMYFTTINRAYGSFKWNNGGTAYYSEDDGATWSSVAAGTSTPYYTTGTRLLWRKRPEGATSSAGIGTLTATADFDVEGNIMSLAYGNDFAGQKALPYSYMFKQLFMSNTHIRNAENLVLPATTLTLDCYRSMFNACTYLMTAPSVLPAIVASDFAYAYMFQRTQITNVPQIRARSMAESTCEGMFQYCTTLATSPTLYTETLALNCYYQMFYGCSALSRIECYATNISATGCLTNWVNGVASSGTFVKAASISSWPTGANGIPSGWTVQNA